VGHLLSSEERHEVPTYPRLVSKEKTASKIQPLQKLKRAGQLF